MIYPLSLTDYAKNPIFRFYIYPKNHGISSHWWFGDPRPLLYTKHNPSNSQGPVILRVIWTCQTNCIKLPWLHPSKATSLVEFDTCLCLALFSPRHFRVYLQQRYSRIEKYVRLVYYSPETNIAPENGWLEDYFPFEGNPSPKTALKGFWDLHIPDTPWDWNIYLHMYDEFI